MSERKFKVIKRADLDAIAQTNSDYKTEYVETPEWGEDTAVLIRSLTGTERDQFEGSMLDIRSKDSFTVKFENVRAKLISMCIIDPDTKERLYKDHEIKLLGNRNAVVLDRIYDACQRLSGLTSKDIQTLTANLKNGVSAVSGSD